MAGSRRESHCSQKICHFIPFCIGAFFANRGGCEKANSHPLRGARSPRAARGRATSRAPRQSRKRSQFRNWMRLRREIAARSPERQSKDKPTQPNKRSWESTAQAFASKNQGPTFFYKDFSANRRFLQDNFLILSMQIFFFALIFAGKFTLRNPDHPNEHILRCKRTGSVCKHACLQRVDSHPV